MSIDINQTGENMDTPYYIGERNDTLHGLKQALADGAEVIGVAGAFAWLALALVGCF